MAGFFSRITVIESDGEKRNVFTLFKKKGRKRKSSRFLAPLEKATRTALEAQQTYADEALERHDRSSRKRKDGWLLDLGLNTMKAQQKAMKKLVKR